MPKSTDSANLRQTILVYSFILTYYGVLVWTLNSLGKCEHSYWKVCIRLWQEISTKSMCGSQILNRFPQEFACTYKKIYGNRFHYGNN